MAWRLHRAAQYQLEQLVRIVSEPAKRATGGQRNSSTGRSSPKTLQCMRCGHFEHHRQGHLQQGSNQRYAIELSEDDLAAIIDAMPDDMKILAAE